jgi:hypothetical protein
MPVRQINQRMGGLTRLPSRAQRFGRYNERRPKGAGRLNALGDHEAAALLSGTTSVANQITSGGQPAEFFASIEAELREHLGSERFAESVARGHALDGDQAVELARRELTKLTTGRASEPSSMSPGDPSRLSAGRT